ncbi:MAG: flagellar biosynthesis protein FlhB [Planctomycetota bacterium]|nr:MAG: flagellar biosynthesis protein FlhB [Planctomycetota bacterium]
MADKPAAEKTEQPTQRHLKKAREKGQVPQSQELPAAVSVVVLVAVLALSAPGLLQWFTVQLKQGVSGEIGVFADSDAFMNFVNGKITSSVLVMCPILAALCAGAVLSCVAVGGLNFAPQALSLKFSAINPVKGFERLFNVKSVVKLAVSTAKLIFVSIIVWFYLRSRIDTLAAMRWAWSGQIIVAIAKMISGMLVRVCAALLLIAAIDVVFQKWKFTQDLKMTKQEVKRERKDTDGSPEVKSRVRRIQIEMARKRMLQEVPKADVVLVNPTHVAVALRYDAKTMEAPVMVAKGADHLAEKIREIASAYGVPIIRKPQLARTIYSTVQPGDAIPQKLYVAIAEVLAMIYRLRHRKV